MHTDFTYDAAAKRVAALLGRYIDLKSKIEINMNTLKGEKVAEEWLKDDGHVGIINVWRPTIRPVEKSPLGFLDVNSVDCRVRSFV